jgi:mRNA-degrading endonuclease RelE of RelBE toxin-antitoxin system
MKVEYSKDFEKSVKKLSGKVLHSIINMIDEVKNASSINDITDCKKIETLNNVYRIRIGSKRAFLCYT